MRPQRKDSETVPARNRPTKPKPKQGGAERELEPAETMNGYIPTEADDLGELREMSAYSMAAFQ